MFTSCLRYFWIRQRDFFQRRQKEKTPFRPESLPGYCPRHDLTR